MYVVPVVCGSVPQLTITTTVCSVISSYFHFFIGVPFTGATQYYKTNNLVTRGLTGTHNIPTCLLSKTKHTTHQILIQQQQQQNSD